MIKKLTIKNIAELNKIDSTIFGSEAYSLNELKAELTLTNRHYYGYFLNNLLVGFVGVMDAYDTADIIKIGVLNEFRNKGIATKLLKNLFNNLKLNNVKYVLLEVNANNLSAIMLYIKLGFFEISKRKNYYKNGDDAIIFKLEI